MERIILDTDIGTDVDDVMAVALAAISPELKVEGITTVYGDVELRARMVVKVLKMLGRQDIPVFAGSRDVLLRNREIWWLGHEGEGLLTVSCERNTAFAGRTSPPPMTGRRCAGGTIWTNIPMTMISIIL